MVSDRADQILRVDRDPLLGRRLRNQQRPVRLPQGRHRVHRERVWRIGRVDPTLHGVVAPPRIPHQLLHRAVSGAQQALDPPAGVLQGVTGRLARLTPVGMIGRLIDDHKIYIVHRVELGAPRQRSRPEDLRHIGFGLECLLEAVPPLSRQIDVVLVCVNDLLEAVECALDAHGILSHVEQTY